MPTKVNALGTDRKTSRSKSKPAKPANGKARRGGKKLRSRAARTLLLSFFTVLISSLIALAVYGYKFVNAPFTSASVVGSENGDIWQKDNINILVIKVDDLNDKFSDINFFSLVNITPNSYHYKTYVFPLDEPLSDPADSKITLKDAYKTGNANGADGVKYIDGLVLRNFAIGLDGYMILDNKGYEKLSSSLNGAIDYNDLSGILRLKNTLKLPGFINEFRKDTVTSLSFTDIWHFLNFLKSTSESSSFTRYLNKYALIDPDIWDQIWREKLNNETVKKEYKKILILNGSKDPKIPGLAKWGARIVGNMGGDILDMQNSFEDFNENTIITIDPELYTVKYLSDTLNIKTVLNKKDLDKTKDYNPEIDRADVTLILLK